MFVRNWKWVVLFWERHQHGGGGPASECAAHAQTAEECGFPTLWQYEGFKLNLNRFYTSTEGLTLKKCRKFHLSPALRGLQVAWARPLLPPPLLQPHLQPALWRNPSTTRTYTHTLTHSWPLIPHTQPFCTCLKKTISSEYSIRAVCESGGLQSRCVSILFPLCLLFDSRGI